MMSMSIADKLAALIQCRTVSEPQERDEATFELFRERFAELFPLLHQHARLTTFDGGGLLFHWRGRRDEHPLVLMAHYDVVPADPDEWTHDPFEGRIIDGCVWGRGALDDKGPLVTIAEAVERLLAEGYVPRSDVWLSFGSDEEVFGNEASQAVDYLRARGVRPWLVSDEGGAIVEGAVPLVKGNTVMVAVTEKGTVDLELVATGAGGHAPTPGKHEPTVRIAQAIAKIEATPTRARLSSPVVDMLQTAADRTPIGIRQMLRKADALNGPLAWLMSKAGPETNALTRTTIAVTRLGGGQAGNVLASEARAHLNIRLAVGDTQDKLLQRLRRLLRGLDVDILDVKGEDPPPISRTDHEPWKALQRAVAAVDSSALVLPYVQTGGSDSRHFTAISDAVYRFAPLAMSAAQRAAIHGSNEYVRAEDLEAGIRFHLSLITDPAR